MTLSDIKQNLKDAGCDNNTIDSFLQKETNKEQLNILTKHRVILLDEVHIANAKLSCLDYLIDKIRKGEC